MNSLQEVKQVDKKPRPYDEICSEIEDQIEELDEKIENCRKHGDREIESALILTRNQLGELLIDLRMSEKMEKLK